MNYAIIAAGEGSRLQQEGVRLPKPLVKLDGTPMIKRLIDIFMANNPESLSIIVNEQMPEVADFLRGLDLPVELHLAVKSTPSSMHSFYEVSRIFEGKGRFILTTVDTIFRPDDFSRYVEAFEKAPAGEIDGMMAVTPFIDDEKPLYVGVDEPSMMINGFLDSMQPGVKYVSGGVYGLGSSAIGVLERCMERGVSRMRNYQRALLEEGLRLKAFPFPKIVDVDHAGDIATAEAFLAAGR